MFRPGLESWASGHEQLVTITHPYELVKGPTHGLFAFDADALEENVKSIESIAAGAGGCEFVTLTQMAARQVAEVPGA